MLVAEDSFDLENVEISRMWRSRECDIGGPARAADERRRRKTALTMDRATTSTALCGGTVEERRTCAFVLELGLSRAAWKLLERTYHQCFSGKDFGARAVGSA
jgi:hypothetical protein